MMSTQLKPTHPTSSVNDESFCISDSDFGVPTEQVCRRVTTAERLRALQLAGTGGGRAVRYQPASAKKGEVFLHPRSALAGAAPGMAVYTELLQGDKRAYMSGEALRFVGLLMCV